jgi:hypothetical protein
LFSGGPEAVQIFGVSGPTSLTVGKNALFVFQGLDGFFEFSNFFGRSLDMGDTADIDGLNADCGRSPPPGPNGVGIYNDGQVIDQKGMFAGRKRGFANGRYPGPVRIDSDRLDSCVN